MQRREFIAGLGAAASPLAAWAQKTAIPVIGFLAAGSLAEWGRVLSGFRQGMEDAGLVDGQNVEVDYRWADNHYDRLPSLVAELLRRQVAVIYAPGSTPAALAAKAATSTVPIVFATGGDPVQSGLVASLNRPGMNATGVGFLTSELVSKQFEIILELVPNASMIGGLVNPGTPVAEPDRRDILEAARLLGRKAVVANATNDQELEAAFRTLVEQRATALVVHGDAFFYSRRKQIVGLAARYRLPAIYAQREFVEDGGLVNYGANLAAANRIASGYLGKILRGASPSDLPVQLSTTLELAINRNTARTLGIDVPSTILLRADEVIE